MRRTAPHPLAFFGSALALASLVPLVATAVARADDRAVDRALVALESGDFDRADRLLDEAIADAGASRADLARAYLYRGFLDDARGRSEESRQAFALAVALEPTIEPARMMGPSVRSHLDEARRASPGAVGLAVSADGPRVRVVVEHGRAALVGTVRVSVDRGPGLEPWSRELDASRDVVLSVPDEVVADAPRTALVTLRAPAGIVVARESVAVASEASPLVLRLEGTRRVRIESAREVEAVLVSAGDGARPTFETTLAPPSPWDVEIPVDAYDDANVLTVRARVRGAAESTTRSIEVPREGDDGGILANPWFWTAIGVVVASAAVAAVVVWETRDVTYDVMPSVR